jgi:uncharacterized protein (TIGR02466 family)
MPLQHTPHFCWITPIVEVRNPDHARIRDGLIQLCYEQEKRAKTTIESGVAPKVKAGLYESPFNFFQANAHVKEVAELRQFCGQAVGEMIFHLNRELNQNKIQLDRINVDMFESWVHITHDGGYHDGHVHPNCSWCGIYYIDIGEVTVDPPNGCNRFYPPMEVNYEDLGTAMCPMNPVQPPPEDGKLILFPSHIRHAGMPYRGKRDRILASFNARVIRGRVEA